MDASLAKANFDYCKQTALLKTSAEITLIDLGGRLHKIFNKELYKPNYDSFKDYLEDLKLSPATASKLIHIHQKLVLKYKYKPKYLAEVGGWSSVSEVVPLITSKKSAEEWLNKVQVLNRQNLRQEITESKTGILMSKCSHPKGGIETLLLKICGRCGERWRVFEDETKQAKK